MGDVQNTNKLAISMTKKFFWMKTHERKKEKQEKSNEHLFDSLKSKTDLGFESIKKQGFI